jgi:predicted dehydrogenase
MAIEGRNEKKHGRIRLGMVGGGEGAFIGAVHRIASRIDDHYELVAGALSSTPEKSRRSGAALGLAADRIYDDFESMAKAEAKRSDGIEAVAIVTPNHMHAPPTYAFLKAGIHVICDKPLTTSLAEAKKMKAAVEKAGLVFALTHNYTGYPLVRQMREMVKAGELGEIRLVQVEYPQDWLTETIEKSGQKQAEWRVDPQRSGAGGSLGDIGTHCYNLADYVTDIELSEISADLTSFGAGRQLDDNAQISLRYANGARGALWASQVAPGNENGLRLRVYGTKGGVHWVQAEPNHMFWSPFAKPIQIITRAGAGAGAAAGRMSRIPPGHPEGYLEGFANIYSEVALAIRAAQAGKKPDKASHFPTIDDGVKGMAFVEAAVKSSRANGKWTKLAI